MLLYPPRLLLPREPTRFSEPLQLPCKIYISSRSFPVELEDLLLLYMGLVPLELDVVLPVLYLVMVEW